MQLTATQTNAVNAYGKFLQAGITHGEAMRQAAAELGGTPCPTFLEALAAKHASKYQCNYTWNDAGSAVFYNGAESTRETRNDAARKSWDRNVMVWFKAPAAPKPQATSQRISKAHREAAKAYLAQFENVKDAIAVLRAVSK